MKIGLTYSTTSAQIESIVTDIRDMLSSSRWYIKKEYNFSKLC